MVRIIVVLVATCKITERPQKVGRNAMKPTNDGTRKTPTSRKGIHTGGENGQEGTSPPNSTNSATPPSSSNKHWLQPRSAREFASQANAVATMLLNGKIDLETARAYASLTRTVAQTLSTEVSKARFLEKPPDLSLDGDVWEE